MPTGTVVINRFTKQTDNDSKPLANGKSTECSFACDEERFISPEENFKFLAEMKYVLTTSILAKCRLLTHKVNFAVNIAFRYALRATYFITQRAEAHLVGATQS